MDKTMEILKSLTDASRAYWESWNPDGAVQQGAEGYFEIELVRAEDYLEEVVGDADL